MTPTFPQLSRNGTQPSELLAQQIAVLSAIRGLLTALRNAEPNSRDYQYRPDEWTKAHAEYIADVRAIEEVKRRAEALATFLSDNSK